MNFNYIHEEARSEVPANELLNEPTQHTCFSGLIDQLFDRSWKNSPSTVMLTSPHRRAGVSFICSNIAAELALQGGKVLLVDAQALLAVRLCSPQLVAALCRRMGHLDVSVLAMEDIGEWSVGPEAGESSVTGSQLRELEREFSFVLIDAPALSAGMDAKLLAPSVYGTVIVARANQTRDEELRKTYQTLTEVGGLVLGSVFNAH